jgi:hypothetical protein
MPNGQVVLFAVIVVTIGFARGELPFRDVAPDAREMSQPRLTLFFIIAGWIFPRHLKLLILFADLLQ